MSPDSGERIGIDTGGTFTDSVIYRNGRIEVHKRLSTPDAPERAILASLSGAGAEGLRLIHGSTVATNALLEGKGVETVYITAHGLADLLTIGRQARRELYSLQPAMVPPPVPASHCLESGGRCDRHGVVLEPLDEEMLDRLCQQIDRLQPQAVAINLPFSWVNDEQERRIAQRIGCHSPRLFVSRSSAVLAEYGEYERGIATWLNSYIGPLVDGYLQRLIDGRGEGSGPVAVIQSCGGTVEAESAAADAVRLLLSGPAGGLIGARHVARLAGCERLLTFDMGGTSTDVALIEGEPQLTNEGRIGDYPVAVPMVDMHTIGAGGGSIARIDAGGALRVGPQSAGAAPGPACYGRGGSLPTVTDANLLLGRLVADRFTIDNRPLDPAAARAALEPLARELGQTLEESAIGIIEVANEQMAGALRQISVARGIDPRNHHLLAFGGAGGLHVCALADKLGMDQALVPIHAGVLSALGMVVARSTRRWSRSLSLLLDDCSEQQVGQLYAPLAERGRLALLREGVDMAQIREQRSVDLRYPGQSFSLNLTWEGIEATREAFHTAHQQRYGHRFDRPVELVTLRLATLGPEPEAAFRSRESQLGAPVANQSAVIYGHDRPVPVYQRERLGNGATIESPALILDPVATIWLSPGWRARIDRFGNLLLKRVR